MDQTKKNHLYIPEPNDKLYHANLEALGSNIAKQLEAHPETPIPIDDDVRVDGLKNPVFLVIIGFSTRRVLEAARKHKKSIVNVLIIEPSLSIFKQTLRREWAADLASSENVDILVGIPPEELSPHLYKILTHIDQKSGSRATRSQQPEIIADPFVYAPKDGKMHPIAEQITRTVVDTAKQVFLSMGCASDSYYRYEQLIRNEESLQKTHRIQPLFGKFENTPVIVVGAGPSMSGFIQAYHDHDLGKKALIIACDASLKKLLENNIKPHIVTRCERKFTQIFEGVKTEDTKGVFYAAYPWCSPEYFGLFEKSFMLFRDNGVCRFSGYDPGSVNGGVSSANAAIELAALLKCPSIIMAGIDLCFIDGNSHLPGTPVEFDIEKSKPKWTQIPGNDGAPVTTIPVWYRCLQEYKGTIFKYPSHKFYNTSLKGAFIAGTQVRSWDNIIHEVLRENQPELPFSIIEKYLEKHQLAYAESLKERKVKCAQYMSEADRDLTNLFQNIDDLLLISQREEQKLIGQLKSYFTASDFFGNVTASLKNMVELYREPCRRIDQFKQKYYPNDLFANTILDITQLDLFQTENRCSGLINLIDKEHERLRFYIHYHLNLFRTFHYYIKELKNLMTLGPNRTVHTEVPVKDEIVDSASASFTPALSQWVSEAPKC